MRTRICVIAVSAGLLALAIPAGAHHSFAAEFAPRAADPSPTPNK